MAKNLLYAKLKKRIEWNKKHVRVKCDCGHYMKDHYTKEGCCDKCGCTWYWPNYNYIMREKKKAAQEKTVEK